jgi:hypothetical protein
MAALLTAGACDAGNARDQFDLGMAALSDGNYAEAYCRWRPLAERGYAEAQYHLGWLYANGNGMRVDIETALAWWRKAARQGHADAQFAVGLAFTTGEGIGSDLNEALKWFLAAARQGHEDARDILIRLNGDPSVKLLETHPEVARESWFGWTARVVGERINARAGPGTEHKIVAQLEEGSELRVIGRREDWRMVLLPPAEDGKTAWVYKSLVSEAAR